MKKFKAIIFALIYFSGLSTMYRLATRNRLRVLCYHRISQFPDDPLLDVSVKRFHAQMQYLKRAYIPLSIEHGINLVKRNDEFNVKPPVSVTFDDGTADWIARALPILEHAQVPATFFVCTGYIDKGPIVYPNTHTPATALTFSELRRLAASPFAVIGGHTMNHPHLSQLNAEDAFQEISGARAQLQEWCGKPVEVFAYPFGDDPDYTEETMALVQRAGFRAALTLDERTCAPGDDYYSIPRVVIFDEPLWMFKVRVSGIIDDFLSLFRKPRRLPPGLDKKVDTPRQETGIHQPAVSVVIRTRNHGLMLKKALEGVAIQTFKDWEALILDEDSSDGTAALAQSFSGRDPRFHYICHSPPLGKTKNCNQGLHMARGEFVAMLDGDDYWCDPEKLERQVSYMRKNSYCTVSAGGVIKIDVARGSRTHGVPNIWRTDHEVRGAIMIVNMIPHSAALFRRVDALMAGGYEECFPLAEDFDLFLKLGVRGSFYMDEHTFCHYHLHEDNATDRQRILQILTTIRIIIRHIRHYPNSVKGLLHNIVRLFSTFIPKLVRQKIGSLFRYRQRLYAYMTNLSQ